MQTCGLLIIVFSTTSCTVTGQTVIIWGCSFPYHSRRPFLPLQNSRDYPFNLIWNAGIYQYSSADWPVSWFERVRMVSRISIWKLNLPDNLLPLPPPSFPPSLPPSDSLWRESSNKLSAFQSEHQSDPPPPLPPFPPSSPSSPLHHITLESRPRFYSIR